MMDCDFGGILFSWLGGRRNLKEEWEQVKEGKMEGGREQPFEQGEWHSTDSWPYQWLLELKLSYALNWVAYKCYWPLGIIATRFPNSNTLSIENTTILCWFYVFRVLILLYIIRVLWLIPQLKWGIMKAAE